MKEVKENKSVDLGNLLILVTIRIDLKDKYMRSFILNSINER